MIWVAGRVVPDEALAIGALDRTFEHGLGLFETLRTWGRRAPLLGRHLARMARSARELGLVIDPASLPAAADVGRLLDAEGIDGDVMLRVTASGGVGEGGASTVWLRAHPLPPEARPEGSIVGAGLWRVDADDPLARHKSLNYWARRRAFELARRCGLGEVLGESGPPGDRHVWEGSRTNVFAVAGDVLKTPAAAGPIVPGIMRGLVLESAATLGLTAREVPALPLAELLDADELFLTNSVRGLRPIRGLVDAAGGREPADWPAPGPWTRRLTDAVRDRLHDPEGLP